MKNSLFVILLFLGMNSFIAAQCKIENLGEGLFSTETALLGDGNSSSIFSILKKDTSYFMKIEYARGFANEMIINDKTPLIFIFNNMVDIIIYPISKSISDASFATKFKYGFIGASEVVPVYSISKEQIRILSLNIPKEVKLYYETNGTPRFNDEYGNYWSILKFEWHYKKRLIKILNCALDTL